MKNKSLLLVCIFCICNQLLFAQDKAASSAEELAKKLANPVSSLISLPFQINTDYGIGKYNGSRNTINVQPVVPISISPKWNLIARVVLPIMSQFDITGENTHQGGLSDAVATAFFSPKEAKNGLTWGAGPAFLIPTATNDFLGTKKWAIGPSAVALKQANGWTYGGLFNQLWSFAGDDARPDVSQLFLQPFITYNWKSGAGIGGAMELTQNWKTSTFSGVFVPTVSGVTKMGKQTVSLAAGPRIPIAGPSSSRPNFGWRASVVLVFPK